MLEARKDIISSDLEGLNIVSSTSHHGVIPPKWAAEEKPYVNEQETSLKKRIKIDAYVPSAYAPKAQKGNGLWQPAWARF